MPSRIVPLSPAAAAVLALLVALAVAAPSPGHRTALAKACSSVPFAPNSDDVAANVRARGVSCTYARTFIRRSNGHPPRRLRGFTCAQRRLETDAGMPYTSFRCVKGARQISWHRF